MGAGILSETGVAANNMVKNGKNLCRVPFQHDKKNRNELLTLRARLINFQPFI